MQVDGQKLRELREAKFLERYQLAKRARLSTGTLGYLETENHPYRTRLSTINRLAEALEVAPSELVKDA